MKESKLQLSDNEKVAVVFGQNFLKAPAVHPQATALYKAMIAGSLVAYAVYMIRRIPAFPKAEIVASYDKAFSIYPNRGILAEKARFYEACKMPVEQKQVQAFLESNTQSMTEMEELFAIVVDDVGRSLENSDAKHLEGQDASHSELKEDSSEAKSIKLLRKAADKGNAKAQRSLGVRYHDGNGVEKDLVEAVKWYRKAAAQGLAQAQHNLGWCYDNGEGIEKNTLEAVKWYRKAAEQGNAKAQYEIGVRYCNGDGVEKDLVEAAKWMRKAADQGNAKAQCSLGNFYYKGDGVQKDAVEAVKWYHKAADQGVADAQGALGAHFIRGLGVIKNEVEGLAWLYVSDANGSEKAAGVISYQQKRANASTISAARQRATAIQAQITLHKVTGKNPG